MSARPDAYTAALARAAAHAASWLASMPDRPVAPRLSADELAGALAQPLPDAPTDAAAVVDLLAAAAEPGLSAMPSGRFFGWVIGGTLPAALAADWLTSAWDQNAGMRFGSPAAAAIEEAAADWLLELLGLPATADVGFVTGATMANFSCLNAARYQVLADAGWDVNSRGLTGAPPVRVLVGEQRHDTIDLALRYLGLGAPTPVDADEQGRLMIDALRAGLAGVDDGAAGANAGRRPGAQVPTIVCLQAGNVHSGAYDPFEDAIAVAHDYGAWVHIDGAFGLWAAATPQLRHLLHGMHAAESWTTDAHKTLNVPYDCGLAVVANSSALRAAHGVRASYLVAAGEHGRGDALETVPELSRRARGIPVWAALRSLGRSGVAELVERLAAHARAIADGIAAIDGAQVLNDVVFTQVCVAFEDDARTRDITDRLRASGTAWLSGSRWRGRDVMRVSVSNWSTDDDDVAATIEAVRLAAGR